MTDWRGENAVYLLKLLLILLVCTVAVSFAWAQPAFDDVDAQLRVKQAATAASEAARKVEALRKALETERQRVVATEGERDLNRATTKALERELQDAEAVQREQNVALWAAQDARNRGLAAEAERRRLQEQRQRQASPPQVPQPPGRAAIDFRGCGLVLTQQTPQGLVVSGFVGTSAELDQILARAREINAASVDVAVRPWPQCEALATLDRGLRSADRPRIRIVRPTSTTRLRAGTSFVVEIDAPETQSFMHVAYIQADGKTTHLMQRSDLSLFPTSGRSKIILGDGHDGGPRFTVSPPFGEEIVVVIASRAPLFAAPRPTVDTAREFLTALRVAILARPDPNMAPRIFSADIDSVVTTEQ